MTATTATPATATGTTAAAATASTSTTDRPRVVRRRPTGRVVAMVAVVSLAAAGALAISTHRDAAPEAPVVSARATTVVGDASHGGPGSRADVARTAIPPREDDRAVLAHGGAGRIVTETGAGAQPS